jgi:hypothetical protein
MRLIISLSLALILSVASAFAETVTTEDVLSDLSTFIPTGATTSSNTNGCTVGQYCTGDATSLGGTYTSLSFDVPLTQDEVQRGFSLDSSVTVDSHSSNASLGTCVTTTQASDCRDLFTVGVTLLDGGSVAGKFTHEVELDFSGQRLFSFSNSITANNFGRLTGKFSLWGIDAGYHSGFFGPQFSDPTLTFTYDALLVEQILDQVTDVMVTTELIAAPQPIIVAPQPVDLPPPPTAPTAQMVFAPAPSEPPAPPQIEMVVADLPAPPAQEQQEAQAEAEAEIAEQIEQAPEPEVEAQPEPEQAEPEPEQAEPEQTEPEQAEPEPEQTEPEPEQTEPEPEAEPEAVAPVQQAAAKPKTRQQKVKAAAEKIVAKIAPSQRYSAASQTTMMVAMGLISPKIVAPGTLIDTPGFFVPGSVPDGPSMVDRMQNYVVFGRSNGAHAAFTQLQWDN